MTKKKEVTQPTEEVLPEEVTSEEEVKTTKETDCPDCQGSGLADAETLCPTCAGHGKVKK